MAEVHHGSLTVRGLRSPVLSAGDASSNTAVVAVHGNPGSGEDWRGLLAAVGERHRAVALDLPGFGQSDKPRDFDHSVAGYAAHLEAALEELGVGRAHLVLHDFGGPWGLAWAAQHPERVASIVLIDTGVLVGYRGHWLARVWVTPGLGEAVMATDPHPRLFGALLEHGYPGKSRPPRLPRVFVDRMAHDFDADTRRAVLRLYRSVVRNAHEVPRLASALRGLDCPVLVVWGGRDHYIGVEHAMRQREVFEHARVVVLPGSGHWPMIDDAATVQGLVADFLG